MKKILSIITFSVIVISMFSTIVPLVKTQANDWSEPQQLTTEPAYDYHSSIMQDSSGKIWLVWASAPSPELVDSGSNLWYKTSLDGGVTWSMATVLVPVNLGVSGTSLLQDSTGRIWVAWASGPGTAFNIYYIASNDGGISWSLPQQLTDYPGDEWYPSLIEVGDEVWIIFGAYGLSNNEDIWYRKTGNGGATWSDPVQLTAHPALESPGVALVVSSGKIWVPWCRRVGGPTSHNIYYKTSTDNGASWSADQELTTSPAVEQRSSIIEDVSGRIFIFYDAVAEPEAPIIRYKTTVDSGGTWFDYQELTADALNDQCPYAALINNEVWVIWHSFGRSESADIWMSKLTLPAITATVNIDPDTLNSKSNGQWITAYIALPEEYRVEDIIPETVKITDIPLVWSEIQDGVFMAKFDRTAVQGLTSEPDYEEGTKFYELTLTITGELLDGTPFEGTDTIRVIMK